MYAFKLYTKMDKGYSWVVLGAATMLITLMPLHVLGVGVLLVAYMHTFNVSKTTVAWIGVCASATGPLLCRHMITDEGKLYSAYCKCTTYTEPC